MLPLRYVRQLAGLTLEQVSERVQADTPELKLGRGSLSAIESGSRGVSDLALAALARAYGLPDDAFVTNYEPRTRRGSTEKDAA